MTEHDMMASSRVATRLNEVIIFRSTGPWSLRWIERNYPTKNFHVKGKSSDWGPQAGFVPYQGKYSKVGGDAGKEAQGTDYNNDGLKHSYTKKTQLCLTEEELQIQLTRPAAGRTALTELMPIHGSPDLLLFALRSSDKQRFAFRAVKVAGHYQIFVFDKAGDPRKLIFEKPTPLDVMTSSEAGAGNKPLTGDYDLMAVCPTWGNYGSRSLTPISKPGIDFGRAGGAEPGQTFGANTNLDAVLDMRTNTGAKGSQTTAADGKVTKVTFQGIAAKNYGNAVKSTPGMGHEHDDMGNLTARILRCINALNGAMGQTGPFRRVHHNAESHRNAIFGGITGAEMAQGEAFPLTVFQPEMLRIPGYENVFTLESIGEFKEYAQKLHQAGFFVPRNWVWGMSIRDGFNVTPVGQH